MIVDKVEHNSDLCERAKNNTLTSDDIIEFFLKQCSGWKGLGGIKCGNSKKYALLNEKESGEEKEYILNSVCF